MITDAGHAALKPLAQRIEDRIAHDAKAAVDDAMNRARHAAFRAYADAFGSLCGRQFELYVADALRSSEQEIRDQAERIVAEAKTAAVLKQLQVSA